MLSLEEIRDALKPMNLRVVSRESGVSYNAVVRLAGGSTNPAYDTVQKIVAFLEKQGVKK